MAEAAASESQALDEELDFYRDDDDVAIVFYDPDGTKHWCLGNIEETSVAKGAVDERRALGGNGPAYLLGLDKVYKPNGVYVNDSKGMFILRWYKEVDKNGKELEGYQNKECAAYKLMTNNDGVPFCWTSTIQIVSKVYLKKHSSQPRSYTLNKKDAKMVEKDVAKRVVVGQ